MNTNYPQVTRYQIAKVYRRDQPAVTRGRYREFYQCDFDIAGEYPSMNPDAEILLIIAEAFEALQINITVKINHRKILDGIFAAAGVPEDKIRTISSAVDKLDKLPWVEVKQEMVQQKGLSEAVADVIGQFVQRRGSLSEMLSLLRSDETLTANENVKAGIEDMSLLLSYLEAYEIADKVSFDLSLARGLDYYTGVIFEVVTAMPKDKDTKKKEPQVGSIAAGGRYDNLVGMYCDRRVPCVGISFGVERIYTILEARQPKTKGQPNKLVLEVDVYVIAAGGSGLLLERMAICGQLTKGGLSAACVRKSKPSMRQQLEAAKNAKAPLTVFIGPDELAAGNVTLKKPTGKEDTSSGAEAQGEKDRGQLVSRENLVAEVKKALQEISQR